MLWLLHFQINDVPIYPCVRYICVDLPAVRSVCARVSHQIPNGWYRVVLRCIDKSTIQIHVIVIVAGISETCISFYNRDSWCGQKGERTEHFQHFIRFWWKIRLYTPSFAWIYCVHMSSTESTISYYCYLCEVNNFCCTFTRNHQQNPTLSIPINCLVHTPICFIWVFVVIHVGSTSLHNFFLFYNYIGTRSMYYFFSIWVHVTSNGMFCVTIITGRAIYSVVYFHYYFFFNVSVRFVYFLHVSRCNCWKSVCESNVLYICMGRNECTQTRPHDSFYQIAFNSHIARHARNSHFSFTES